MLSNIHILLVPRKCEIVGIDSRMVPKKRWYQTNTGRDLYSSLGARQLIAWFHLNTKGRIFVHIWLCYKFVALLALLVSKTARSWCSRTTRLEGSWISVVVVHCGPPLSKMEIWWPTVYCCQVAHEWPLKVRAHTIARYFWVQFGRSHTAALTLLQEAYKNRLSSGTRSHMSYIPGTLSNEHVCIRGRIHNCLDPKWLSFFWTFEVENFVN